MDCKFGHVSAAPLLNNDKNINKLNKKRMFSGILVQKVKVTWSFDIVFREGRRMNRKAII